MKSEVQVGSVWRRKQSPRWLIKVVAVDGKWAKVEFSCGGYDEREVDDVAKWYEPSSDPFEANLSPPGSGFEGLARDVQGEGR